MTMFKYLISAIIALVTTGAVPSLSGLTGWQLIAATAVVAAINALWNLYTHKPGTEPAKVAGPDLGK